LCYYIINIFTFLDHFSSTFKILKIELGPQGTSISDTACLFLKRA
jgi:hypothetical protein